MHVSNDLQHMVQFLQSMGSLKADGAPQSATKEESLVGPKSGGIEILPRNLLP